MGDDVGLSQWSYSRLTVFEQCKLRAKLQYIDKIPEPPRPLPPGKTEHPDQRGIRVHEAAELYVRGGVEMIRELCLFKEEYEALRELYKEGAVVLEEEWAFDRNWQSTAWNSATAWVRLKADALLVSKDGTGLLVDYKTGRRDGNEIKHTEQGQLYSVAACLRHPELQQLTVEFWYLDKDDLARQRYSRLEALSFLKKFEQRGLNVTEAIDYPANPNIFSCRYCPYGPRGTKHCTVGV